MTPSVIFAIVLFALTYILLFTLQNLRPYIALASAVIFVIVGSSGKFGDFSYSPMDALSAIDWNVIMMIAGTAGTVYLFIESGMPKRLADILMGSVRSVKWMICVLSLFAGFISAFVDNVATVLMIAPVALAVCRELDISPVPAVICVSISSNLQGAATLVGDTTSILLAKAANLDFTDFFFVDGHAGMFWVTEAGAMISALMILFLFRKENKPIDYSELTPVSDRFPFVTLILTIVTLIAVSFIPYESNAAPGQFYKPDITNGLICLSFFFIALLRKVLNDLSLGSAKAAFRELDYHTIFLLIGLFMVIGGVERAGVIELIGRSLASISGDGSRMSVFLIYSLIVWMSVLFSAFIDNIPYTATMLPVVAVLSSQLSAAGGLDINPNLFYFGLLVGATLGGNLTPVGASANITGIGILRKAGYTVANKTFMKYSVPFTLAAVTTGYVLIWLIWM